MALGAGLRRRTHLCIVGCTPGIFFGQPHRTTQSIDVWEPQSTFDRTDLARACERVGWRCSPADESDAGPPVLRFLGPDTLGLPASLELREIETYRRLKLSMPSPAILVASALSRGQPTDVDDLVFWIGERRLDLASIEQAIEQLPAGELRDAAQLNKAFAELVTGNRSHVG